MSWFLTHLSIEGFRGINNNGDAFKLKFKPDTINSVFATNGIGKSSIYDAITYAITGSIPKLKALPATEDANSYYLNRFNPNAQGTIALTFSPEAGGADITITVVRQANGLRTVTASDGSDGETFLKALNREFVLLDARTFQNFIESTPLERGRAFSGLLGLGSYSLLRQGLQAAANTRAFNNHFGMAGKTADQLRLKKEAVNNLKSISEAFKALTGEEFDPAFSAADVDAMALAALTNIPLVKGNCDGKSFAEISPDDCVATIKDAEGGKERDRLTALVRREAELIAAQNEMPGTNDRDTLVTLATQRDDALALTRGNDFLSLFKMTAKILASDAWPDKSKCPACDGEPGGDLAAHLGTKVGQFDAASAAAVALQTEWTARGWDKAASLEKLTLADGETATVAATGMSVKVDKLSAGDAATFVARMGELAQRAETELGIVTTEKLELEQKLPASLVAVTEKVEAARRLQKALIESASIAEQNTANDAAIARVSRVKDFLDSASGGFSDAESTAGTRRLAAVQPACQDIFQNIMFEQVVPAITKRAGSEDLSISLAEFHTLQNVSAASVLSESFRNACAISVDLAAASLYGGGAKFLLFDDITSSFDGGHQFHLMEVFRTRFARPGVAGGPQVILLSHDSLLEKFFNAQNGPGWYHQRIQGNPRTSVRSHAGANVAMAQRIHDLLNVGNAADAGQHIRDYLENRLSEIISQCKISVPIDVAMSDNKRMCGNYVKAIDEQVKLHTAANTLILDAAQRAGLNTAMTTIVANFLSHWNTDQTGTFTAGALRGVMTAIESYTDCFKFEPVPGAPKKYYRTLASRT